MEHDVQLGRRKRVSYSQINEVLDMPDLIEVQKNSYWRFVNDDFMEVLRDSSRSRDSYRQACACFVGYEIDRDNPRQA